MQWRHAVLEMLCDVLGVLDSGDNRRLLGRTDLNAVVVLVNRVLRREIRNMGT